MKTYNIYIQGVVQGVGFRPFVYKLARDKYVGCGVFQNSCLIDLIIEFMGNDCDFFFNEELSPNDENISFGQLIAYLQKDIT